MKNWQKIAIGAAIVLSFGLIGYALYKKRQRALLLSSGREKAEVYEIKESLPEETAGNTVGGIQTPQVQNAEVEEEFSQDESTDIKEIDATDLIEEVFVESLDSIINYAKMAANIGRVDMSQAIREKSMS